MDLYRVPVDTGRGTTRLLRPLYFLARLRVMTSLNTVVGSGGDHSVYRSMWGQRLILPQLTGETEI
jgi:hypothetical protein